MLAEIEISHFKCFERLRLPLSPLTLLSGTNGSGKSSVLQALVLLHQTMREHEWSSRLMLNGSSIRLGTVSDVVDKVHGRRGFELGLVDDETSVRWGFAGERGDLSMAVELAVVEGAATERPDPMRYLMPVSPSEAATALASRLVGLGYITAERMGPREVYTLEDPQIASVVGPTGEYAASVLHWQRDEDVLSELVLADAPPTLLRQVEARMQEFFPRFGLALEQVPRANAVSLGFRTSEDTDFHRPANVGFGLTQVLPIVVAALSARAGNILLIENPEVHLHPAGQALMGRFLADVARAGVQVILETHSDHVLNGIRRAVKSSVLDREWVSVHFFKSRSEIGPQVHSPLMDANGNLDSWPDGFFDQFDKDTNYFADWDS